MESSNLDTTEEIVIVGSRHGALADIVKPLFEKGDPIKRKDIKTILGGDEVLIYPERNRYDKYAVGVYTKTQRMIGHVWSSQSPDIAEWMKENKRDFVRGYIHEISSEDGLMVAVVDTPLPLGKLSRNSKWDGYEWADDLPEEIINNGNRKLMVSIELLKEELRKATEWNDNLQFRIDCLLNNLSKDLSPRCNDEGQVIYKLMKTSEIKEVRSKRYKVASAFVKRGTEKNMEWWVNEWLPQFLKESANADLMGMFEADTYDLKRVEEILDHAPEKLFQLYKVNKARFAKQLYYAALSDPLYNRFLTLLAVWEAMRGNGECLMDDGRCQTEDGSCQGERVIDSNVLKKAAVKVKPFMWAASSYAVLFCVCRDKYGIPDNMSQFERDFSNTKTGYCCKEGVVSSTFRTNSYMKLHIDRWEQNGAKERTLILKDRFIEEVNKLIQE